MCSKASWLAATGRRHSSSTASASAASTVASRVWGELVASVSAASAPLAFGIVPTSLAAPGIAGLRLVRLRSALPRWVRRRQVPIRTMAAPPAAITPIRLATEDCGSHAYEQDRLARSLGLAHLRDSCAGIGAATAAEYPFHSRRQHRLRRHAGLSP